MINVGLVFTLLVIAVVLWLVYDWMDKPPFV